MENLGNHEAWPTRWHHELGTPPSRPPQVSSHVTAKERFQPMGMAQVRSRCDLEFLTMVGREEPRLYNFFLSPGNPQQHVSDHQKPIHQHPPPPKKNVPST